MSKMEEMAKEQTTELMKRARTISGNNIKGTAKILSAAELQIMLNDFGGVDDEELNARLEKLKNDLNSKHQEEINALQNRISELEALLKQADNDKQAAVDAAKLESAGRISELEAILANDDARSKVAFLEKEVARLQALLDRYATDLEVITTVDKADVTTDLDTCQALQSKASGDLLSRVSYIKTALEDSDKLISATLKDINNNGIGSVYACLDLIETSMAVRHYRQEIISIESALG